MLVPVLYGIGYLATVGLTALAFWLYTQAFGVEVSLSVWAIGGLVYIVWAMLKSLFSQSK